MSHLELEDVVDSVVYNRQSKTLMLLQISDFSFCFLQFTNMTLSIAPFSRTTEALSNDIKNASSVEYR